MCERVKDAWHSWEDISKGGANEVHIMSATAWLHRSPRLSVDVFQLLYVALFCTSFLCLNTFSVSEDAYSADTVIWSQKLFETKLQLTVCMFFVFFICENDYSWEVYHPKHI